MKKQNWKAKIKLLFQPKRMKRWRIDLNMWEQQSTYVHVFTIYTYSLFGKKDIIRLTKTKNPNYFEFNLALNSRKPQVGLAEFHNTYKGNKEAIPVNYEINVLMP